MRDTIRGNKVVYGATMAPWRQSHRWRQLWRQSHRWRQSQRALAPQPSLAPALAPALAPEPLMASIFGAGAINGARLWRHGARAKEGCLFGARAIYGAQSCLCVTQHNDIARRLAPRAVSARVDRLQLACPLHLWRQLWRQSSWRQRLP